MLQLWHSIVNRNDDQGNSCDYLDLLNCWIPNKCLQISGEAGFHIQGRLGREASSVVSKYRKASSSGKKQELNNNVFTEVF